MNRARGLVTFAGEVANGSDHSDHVESGNAYRIRGWITERKKRLLKTEAALTTPDGKERAHAWAVFVVLPKTRDSVMMPGEMPG